MKVILLLVLIFSFSFAVDTDLTKMTSTMVFAQVNDMLNTRPAHYLGKTIKAEGIYAASSNKKYHFIVIQDAASCCAQGIEIIYKEGNYPEPGTKIQIEGVFSKYIENSKTIYYIDITKFSLI